MTAPMPDGGERRLSTRSRELLGGGQAVLRALPTPEELAAHPENRRRDVLDRLRVDLYALSSILADGAVHRARDAVPEYPPHGLVRSMYSQLRMVVAFPGPFEEGSVDSFRALGNAYLDTMVFHLDLQFKAMHGSDQAWMLVRLEELLSLFRIYAGPATKPRVRDGFTFLYGGLHFGVSVCVQMVEAMSRLLDAHPDLTPDERMSVLARSTRPAFQLASVNVEEVVGAYQRLLSGEWMNPDRFIVHSADGRPSRIDLRDADVRGPDARSGRRPVFTTQGCPARISPAGGPSSIARLWSWCVELSGQLDLLGPSDAGDEAATR